MVINVKNNKINVVYLVNDFGIGGLERCVVDLVNNLDPDVFQPSIFCLKKKGGSVDFITRNDVKIYELNKRAGNDPFILWKLRNLLKHERTTIVHSGNWVTMLEGVVSAKLARVPVAIHMEQGKELSDVNEKGFRKRKRNVLKKYLSYGIDQIVTVSEDLRQEIIRDTGITPGKVISIPNSVPVINKVDKKEGKRMLHKLGICDNRPLIGTVGRHSTVKNYQFLVQSMPQVLKEFPNAQFVFIGDGPETDNLKNMTKQLKVEKSVWFLGGFKNSKTKLLLQGFDIFVLPSFFEGISFSILEAMSMGIPVVATDVGGNPEVVANGETGFLAPLNDVDMLSNSIIDLLSSNEKAEKMGAMGRKVVEQNFSLEKMVSRYEDLYLTKLGLKQR